MEVKAKHGIHCRSVNLVAAFREIYFEVTGFSGGSAVKNSPIMQELHETLVQLLSQEDPLEEDMAAQSRLPGESRGQKSLVGYSPWGHRESLKIELT